VFKPDAGIAQGAHRGHRGAGIVDLKTPGKLRQRQVEQAGFVLVDKAAVLLEGLPILARDGQRGVHLRRDALDRHQALVGLRRDDRRHPLLEDAGLLAGDGRQRIAEKVLVVVVDGGDDAEARPGHDIGGVEPPAEADLEQQGSRRACAKRRAGRPPW
jgi:hypothetical protein